jgi:hypothetical protein
MLKLRSAGLPGGNADLRQALVRVRCDTIKPDVGL